MRDLLVLCGDLSANRRDGARALRLDVGAARGQEGRINLQVSQITRTMVANLPDRVADLLEIACYVYSAHQLTRREGRTMPHMGADWRRTFRFRIAVRDPAFWNSEEIRTLLAETLGFLSEDSFEFAFERTRRQSSAQGFLELEGDGPAAGFRPERVILFSGGLDSMAGAAESLLRERVPVVLVSHHSSNLARGVQRTLAEALRTRAGADRLLHVTVRINKGSGGAVEDSQRTRAFLFASLAFAVASMMGQRQVTFYENGIVSLNLPLAGHVLGTRATRTTHPRSLVEFGRLFSAIAGAEMRVENPFLWDTKAGVIRRLADAGCASLIARTFSCANVRRATSFGGQHCGVCSQCLDRRFGVLAAGCGQHEPAELYATDLFRGARDTTTEITMAEAYVLTAHRHAGMSEAAFLGSRGEIFRVLPCLGLPLQEAVRRLHELHQRHGREVLAVVDAQMPGRDFLSDRLDLPDTSLLAMLQAPAAPEIEPRDVTEREPPASDRVRQSGRRSLPRPLRFALDSAKRRVVFGGGPQLKGTAHTLMSTLLPQFLAGQQKGEGPDGFAFMAPEALAGKLRITDESLRRQVSRLRNGLAGQFNTMFGALLHEDDVIENKPRSGYRLNPRLVQDASLVGGAIVVPSRVTRPSPDVTTLS
jgi:hypothetical protein